MAATVGNGNAIVGIASWDGTGGHVLISVADDKGNTYNLGTQLGPDANGQASRTFWRGNITNAPQIITGTFTAGTAFPAIICDEFSGGAALSDPNDGHIDQVQATPGTGTDAISSTSVTTTVDGDLIWGGTIDTDGANTASAGTGFTAATRDTSQGYELFSEYKTQTTHGSVAATFTQATGNHRLTSVVTLQPASGGAAPFVPYNPWPQAAPILAT